MKLSLVVAEGVHQGKAIPITVPEFTIGRDPECQLRPASVQVSKKHCSLIVKDGKVWIRDYGSMNGTFINGEQVAGDVELKNGDHLKAGPMSFAIKIELTAAKAAAKPVAATVGATTGVSASDSNPDIDEDQENMAAMLLGGDDESASADRTAEQAVPDGTTVMELPAIPGDPNAKKDKPDPNTADTSSAAKAILQKYMRRPRT